MNTTAFPSLKRLAVYLTAWAALAACQAPPTLPTVPTVPTASATPQEFAPGVVSTGHEFGISFSPDGTRVYFSRSNRPGPTHIFEARFQDGRWQDAKPVSFSGEGWSDLDPFVSEDGQQLFFISTRDAPGAAPGKKNMDIWVAQRQGDQWGTPRWLPNVNSDGKEGTPTVARDGTLYFFSDRNNSPNSNALYVARRGAAGEYTAPVRLPAPLNSGVSDTSPYITADGKTLLFYSTRPGGYGKADLYAARWAGSNWADPVNLGPSVNNADFNYNPVLSADGRNLFFGRGARLYVVAAASLNGLK